MALTYNRQVRTLGIRGVITLTSGAQVNLTAEDVLYYSISESCGEDGLPLGTAEAASFELTISNVGKGYTPDQFDNAEVHMQIGIETDGAIAYSDFGVWYVCEVNAPEQSVSIDLSGYDALATLFEVDYTDSEGAYPTSLGSLASTICAAAGISLKSRNFVNADIQVSKMPEWGANATLRSIIGFISACAGGFAHIDRSGLLEIVSYNSGSEYEIDTDLYSALTRTNGTSFSFNALQVKFVDSEDDAYTRYALQTSTEDNPTNTIRIENNPLFTEGIANSVVTLLAGVSANPASVNWGGDPIVKLGDVLIATNMAGDRVRLIVNSQSFSFSGGFNAESACTLPALNTINGSSYTSSGNIMDGNGNIKAERITNLDRTIVSATIGHFEKLDAESIKTDTLLAAIIDAVILKAQNISADSVVTDKLTSAIAEIVNATIRKLNAGTITTDELYASYAELFTLKTDSITADNILTDELAAALANITVLACGSATFDKATIQHLVAEAMNLEYGVAGQVFIKNLAVEYAQMVGATIGNLCIKASDGNYYTIDVDENGNVSATKTTVSSGEISAGQTSGGRVILETNITAANLNTSNLLATYALINKIDAARIDVAELFAQRAFVDALYTSKIYGDKSIEMIVGQVNQNAEDIANLDSLDIYTGNTPPAAPLAEGKLWIDTGVSPTVIRRWRGLDVSTDREYSIAGSAFSLSTIDAYFTISNGSGTSGWTLASNSSAGVNLAPGNIGVNNSTATITLKAVRALSNVVITGAYYTEAKFDKITLTVAGTTVLNAVSGTSASAQRFSGSIASGKEIVLKYVKDVSNSATNEANTLFTITSSDTVPDGYTASGWDTISDTQEIERILGQVEQTAESAQDAASSAQNTAASAQDAAESAKSTADSALPRVEFQRVVRIDDEGLHVGDNQSNGEVLVDSNSVNVVFNGQKYSKFSGNYVQFGNYQLRRSSDGGLVFKLA